MGQLPFNLQDGQLETIDLPALVVGPISHAVGQIRHVLRNAERGTVEEITNIQISPRTREPLYRLGNGDHIVITQRRSVARPEGADGVLQATHGGTYRWLSHRRVEAFLADVDRRGWPTIALEIAAGWNGKLAFKAERTNQGGFVGAGNEGLRPPQLGALHAIGAHWSLH